MRARRLGFMSAEPVIRVDRNDGRSAQCWCCGSVDGSDRMVHLGDHPEVHLCLGCAHFVHQRAWQIEDRGKRGPAALARDRVRTLHAGAMRRGWLQNRYVGGRLRWLSKHLP
jgi:hypothetical protein